MKMPDDFIQKFEPNKRYKFSKEVYVNRHSGIDEHTPFFVWVRACDGEEIKVKDERTGYIKCFSICPEWCVEIENDMGEQL